MPSPRLRAGASDRGPPPSSRASGTPTSSRRGSLRRRAKRRPQAPSRRQPGPLAGCSRHSGEGDRSSSCSRTCTGGHRPSSTSSSMWPSSPGRRSCCSASRDPSSSIPGRNGPGGRLNASSILLDALPLDQARVLLDRLDTDTALDDDNRAAILAGAAGNPLFLEQLLAAALKARPASGLDSRFALGEARPASRGRAPSRPGSRHLRRDIPNRVVQSLVDVDVRSALVTLGRRVFVEAAAPDVLGDEVWGFRHALVRDEAYAGITSASARPCIRRSQASSPTAPPGGASKPTSSSATTWRPRTTRRRGRSACARARGPRGRRGATPDRSRPPDVRRARSGNDCRTATPAAALLPADAPERLELAPPGRRARVDDERDVAARVLDEAAAAAPRGDERTHARLEVARLNLAFWGPASVDPEGMFEDLRKAIAVHERPATTKHSRTPTWSRTTCRTVARPAPERRRSTPKSSSGWQRSTHVPPARASSKVSP